MARLTRAGAKLVYQSPTLEVHFKLDRAGIARIAVGKDLRSAVIAIAKLGKPYAEQVAPRSGDRRGKPYAESFVVVPGHAWVAALRRVAAFLANTHPGAAAIEFGSKRNEPFHVLRQTLEYLGTRPTARGMLGMPTVRPRD